MFQADAGQPLRANQNGGVIVFGPEDGEDEVDGEMESRAKLYVQVGDTGRRGQLQNLEDGPLGPDIPDDQFGGPAPDNAHLAGMIYASTTTGRPRDNPSSRSAPRLAAKPARIYRRCSRTAPERFRHGL